MSSRVLELNAWARQLQLICISASSKKMVIWWSYYLLSSKVNLLHSGGLVLFSSQLIILVWKSNSGRQNLLVHYFTERFWGFLMVGFFYEMGQGERSIYRSFDVWKLWILLVHLRNGVREIFGFVWDIASLVIMPWLFGFDAFCDDHPSNNQEIKKSPLEKLIQGILLLHEKLISSTWIQRSF